jgi:hypothetical protein
MLRSTTIRRRVTTATIIWGIVFTIVHVYWAFGGGSGLSHDGNASLGASLYVGFIALLGLAGTVVAYSLERPMGASIGVRQLRLIARIGGIALLLGVVVGVGRWIAAGSLGDDGIAGIVITAYFFVGGIFYVLLGWSNQPLAVAARHQHDRD